MRIFKASIAIIFVCFASGCAEWKARWADRYGPAPIQDPVAVRDALDRQTRVVLSLVEASGFKIHREPPQYPVSRAEWYAVILTGFNVVDDACTTYTNDLWKLDRERGRVKDVLAATAAATAAIIGTQAHPSAATLIILAQVFGLGTNVFNAVAESYLYSQDPATVKMIIKKSTEAYRDDLYKHMSDKIEASYPMASAPAAYHHVREYLSLCLPTTIQTQINDYLAKAKAKAETAQKNTKSKTTTTNIQLVAPN